MLKENFVRKAVTKFKDKFNYKLLPNRIVFGKKYKFVCKKHGEFLTTPESHLESKTGCPKCGLENIRVMNFEDFKKEVMKKYGGKYIIKESEFINLSTKMTITCKKHGDFKILPFKFLRDFECPECVLEIKQKERFQLFLRKAREVHGDKYEYEFKPIKNLKSKIKIFCRKHGWFEQEARVHLAGSGCVLCSKEKFIMSKEDFIKKAKNIHGEIYDYSKVIYLNNKTKVEIICKKHGSFFVRPDQHLYQKNGCPRCRMSFGEKKVAHFLNFYGIKYEFDVKLKNVKEKFRFDFVLEEQKILIEFDGIQHFQPVERFGGKDGFKKTKERDKEKNFLASILGYKLIRIKYTDINFLGKILIRKLKSIYPIWLKKDEKILVFKTILDLVEYFKLDSDISLGDLKKNIEKFTDAKIIF